MKAAILTVLLFATAPAFAGPTSEYNLEASARYRCVSWGAQPGTPQFAQCMASLLGTAQAQDQADQQQAAATAEREREARLCYSSGLMQPTRTGSYAESLANANRAYVDCLNGRAPSQMPPPQQTYCQPNGNGISCTTQ